MPETNTTSAKTIREIEYSIRIKDRDSSFAELIDLLRDELTKFRFSVRHNRPETENPVRDFIQTNIERSIIVDKNSRIYFLDYKERESLLRIGFTLFVFTDAASYTSIKLELDSIVRDSIVGYFTELLERHTPVTITVQSDDNELYALAEPIPVPPEVIRPKRDVFTRTLAIIALVISLGIGGLYVFRVFNHSITTENAKLRDEYIDALLDKKIIEAVKDQKFTINLYKIADTAGTSKDTSLPDKEKE